MPGCPVVRDVRERDVREKDTPMISDAEGRSLAITDSAAARILTLAARENVGGSMLRLAVRGGGCAGFQYDFSFENAATDEDCIFRQGNAQVVIDRISLDMLNGATLDFVEDLMGSSFQVRNPQATSSCGCGTSFAV